MEKGSFLLLSHVSLNEQLHRKPNKNENSLCYEKSVLQKVLIEGIYKITLYSLHTLSFNIPYFTLALLPFRWFCVSPSKGLIALSLISFRF
jgi:hypothetical protein